MTASARFAAFAPHCNFDPLVSCTLGRPHAEPAAHFKPTALRRLAVTIVSTGLAGAALLAQADTGKLLLTGGVSSVEGAAGGGISPWATIGSNATGGEWGGSAYASRLRTRDFGLTSYGAAAAWNERIELSLARQRFATGPADALNGLGFAIAPDEHLHLDVLGVKLRLAGDAVLDSDNAMPQISIGVQQKRLHAGTVRPVLDFLGSRNHGTDLYASATKLLLAQGLLINGTLRCTNANQGGLLGFGSASPGRNSRSLQPEISAAYLLRRDLAVGAEYRFKPDNLRELGQAAGLANGLREDNWKDLFVAWAPGKNLSLTLAWVDLGRVLPGVSGDRRQRGAYLSVQGAF